jgi:hypothetical protein
MASGERKSSSRGVLGCEATSSESLVGESETEERSDDAERGAVDVCDRSEDIGSKGWVLCGIVEDVEGCRSGCDWVRIAAWLVGGAGGVVIVASGVEGVKSEKCRRLVGLLCDDTAKCIAGCFPKATADG